MNYTEELKTLFKNISLNALGVERDFLTLLNDKDVAKAVSMMQNRSEEVDEAIKEYHSETHKVMNRRDKHRKNDRPYEVEKLPRSRQVYINEIELFFLLGAPLLYTKKDGDDSTYELYTSFIDNYRMNTLHREFKRLCGSETEAAIVFHMFRGEDNSIECKPFIAARSTGYDIRPMFDQYGNMLAFAYGYKVKDSTGTKEMWEILTPKMNFTCKHNKLGWEVEARENLVGKICAIYGKQQKPWGGVQRRIEREEMIDSKTADTNNYFADPIAYATADVVKLMGENKDRIGTLLQYTGKDSQFGYINPPQNSETRRDEKTELGSSILFDTFTPDLSYENIKGLGSLSGVALENALMLGFIKRAANIDIYGELFDREKNVTLAILKVMHPEKRAALDALNVVVEFQSPFVNQKEGKWASIGSLYQSGVCSLETAVEMLSLTDAPEEEVAKIKAMQVKPAE